MKHYRCPFSPSQGHCVFSEWDGDLQKDIQQREAKYAFSGLGFSLVSAWADNPNMQYQTSDLQNYGLINEVPTSVFGYTAIEN